MDLIQNKDRKEYFRNYYLANKLKFKRPNTDDEIKKNKRGRPKKIVPVFKMQTGTFIVSFL